MKYIALLMIFFPVFAQTDRFLLIDENNLIQGVNRVKNTSIPKNWKEHKIMDSPILSKIRLGETRVYFDTYGNIEGFLTIFWKHSFEFIPARTDNCRKVF